MKEIEKLCLRHQAQFLPKICDWMLNKNYESHVNQILKLLGIVLNFLHFVIE